ncbi:cytochrome c biogenesis CcdA family protein [Demequina muriae]|uniref:Cytochrome c biogenesis protein CcdA n=1 Tax=Demequina muriae TaxID=3051664 RepID=A0ABT8GHA4_9MICO|nr:cytochrome c biogenesis protein CcdA [Demequina sp. EGI L300058]MDN4480744.1 cytochrome c biogenesis protein CcdA [Demequina sp. EGI L300058]
MLTSLTAGIGSDFSSQVLSGSLLAAIPIALLAGLVSFASPCVVPLVPGYLGYLSGMAGADAGRKSSRPRLVLGVLLFILGFSAVFVTLGIVVSAAGAQFDAQLDIITRVLGVFVILMGLAFMGAMPFLQNERRLHVNPKAGLAGAPLLGIVFGLGWTPCIGPTLSAVITLGLNEGTVGRGALLAVVYSLGIGLPFLALALWFERSGALLRWLRRHRRGLQLFGGAMLVILGVLLVTGLWGRLTGLMQGWIDGFWVAV